MGKNSKESQEQYGCGNCVAMSINLQKLLKKHDIKSKLVPATIPKMYYMSDFLDISHVAVLILKNDKEGYLIDPAFYFLEPMKININDRENNVIPWKNVYRGDEEDLTYNLQHLNHDLKYNDYQTIPKNTYMIETFRTNDPSDKWNYYLTEITNPDNAITSFNLTSKKFPFMAALDEQLNLKLFVAGKVISNAINKEGNKDKLMNLFNICSISNYTLNYKGMLLSDLVRRFFFSE